MTPPPRPLVLRIITRLAGGGPPVHATILNRKLAALGFDSVLVFGDCAPGEKNMEYLLEPGDRIERIPALGATPNPLRDWFALVALYRLMRRLRPVIVHTHTAKAGFLGRLAALLAGVPCVVHTYHGHVLSGYFSATVSTLLQWLERLLGLGSSALVTVSAQQAHELSQLFSIAPSEKMHVVPLGLNLEPFLHLPPPTQTPTLTVGWLGRFVPIKNIQLLASILTTASARRLPVRFLVAGDGPDRPWLQSQIEQAGLTNVTLLPWQDQVEAVLRECDLMMLTSHREGTPLALIQGLAAARPFVSTAAGGTVDLATGVCRPAPSAWWYDNAVLVPPHADAFCDVFEKLLQPASPLEAMSQSARHFASSHFGEDRLAADIVSLYRQLLQQPSPQASKIREAHS